MQTSVATKGRDISHSEIQAVLQKAHGLYNEKLTLTGFGLFGLLGNTTQRWPRSMIGGPHMVGLRGR